VSQFDLLRYIAELLNRLNIPFMLVGSHASSYYGEARSTHDIDIVIDLDPRHIPGLIKNIDPGRYYISESALREGRMANLIDTHTGDKVDFFILDGAPENRVAFDRRSVKSILGVEIPIASAEDTILAKLRWSEMSGGSQRQISDIQQILRVQRNRLDENYLHEQADRMGLARQWSTLISALDNDHGI